MIYAKIISTFVGVDGSLDDLTSHSAWSTPDMTRWRLPVQLKSLDSKSSLEVWKSPQGARLRWIIKDHLLRALSEHRHTRNDCHSTLPPPRKHYENNSPRVFLCNFWGRLRQNCVITQKLTPQALFCVIDDRRDLRLVHVELREIYVTPKKIFLRECVFRNWLRKTVAITPKIIPQDFVLRK